MESKINYDLVAQLDTNYKAFSHVGSIRQKCLLFNLCDVMCRQSIRLVWHTNERKYRRLPFRESNP